MAPDRTNDDEQLLAELRESYARTDPVPADVMTAARAAIELRDLEAQLVELLRDSSVEDKELAGVRGLGQRLLTFGRGDHFLEVDVAVDGDERALRGYVVPADEGILVVEYPGGSTETPLDDRGRFCVERVPRGPVRLRLARPRIPALVTPWIPV